MSNALQVLQGDIYAQEQAFNQVSAFDVDKQNAFRREAGFAMQIISANGFMQKIAMSNRQSLVDAVINVGAIGISLNPAEKEAYLVPRDGKVCLDISYMGLIRLATDTGAVQWVQAGVVYEGDQFIINGLDKQPTHVYNAFDESRTVPVGAYVTAKLSNGDFLTDTMTSREINAIRDSSQGHKAFISGRAKSSVWNSHWAEMAKKTVVKRGSKYWPKSETLSKAIHVLNTESGEGIIDVQAEEADPQLMQLEWQERLLAIQNIDQLREQSRKAPREVFAAIKDTVVAHAETLKNEPIEHEKGE